jgi:hypothetical protein
MSGNRYTEGKNNWNINKAYGVCSDLLGSIDLPMVRPSAMAFGEDLYQEKLTC